MEVIRPRSSVEAQAALQRGAAAVAGGTVMTRWLAESPGRAGLTTLVDLSTLDDLRGVNEVEGEVRIGVLTSVAELAQRSGALGQAARAIANPNIRNAATLGGNLAGRFPGADMHVAALVLDAQVELLTANGNVTLPVETLIEAGIPEGALLLSMRYALDREAQSRFHKLAWRSASGKTLVSVGAHASVANGTFGSVRLAIAGLANVARRAPAAEQMLEGAAATSPNIEAAVAVAGETLVFELEGAPSERYRRDAASHRLCALLQELASL